MVFIVEYLNRFHKSFYFYNSITYSKFDPIFVLVVFHWNASVVVSSNLTDVGNASSSGVRPNLMRSNADSLVVKIESLSHPVCSNVNSSRDISCMLDPEMNRISNLENWLSEAQRQKHTSYMKLIKYARIRLVSIIGHKKLSRSSSLVFL